MITNIGGIRSTQSGRSPNINSASSVLLNYRGPSGQIYTDALARDLADTADQNLDQANTAFEAISNELDANGEAAELGQLERAVSGEFEQRGAGGLWAPGYRSHAATVLRQNPIVEIRWENTVSAVNGKSGFSGPLTDFLSSNGITVVDNINSPPAGSLTRSDSGSTGYKNNVNGSVAQVEIRDRFRAAGFSSEIEVNYDTATGRQTTATAGADAVGSVRRVDIETQLPGTRPELNTVVLTESKVGYTSNSGRAAVEAVNDAALLANNQKVRSVGRVAEGFGRVARPVGVALDVYSLRAAYSADGGQIGSNTKRTASGIAGSVAGGTGGALAGAAAGAAIGSLVPIIGTAIGGIVGGVFGGIAGGIGGDAAGKSLFGWFGGS